MPMVNPQDLSEGLQKRRRDPVIVLLGTEAYLREECCARIVDAWVDPSAQEWGYSRFSAEDDDLGRILGQARTLPMLAPQQVIVVGALQAIEKASEEKREILIKQLAEYLEDPSPFTVLVLEAASLDQRMKLAKLLMDRALVVDASLPQDPDQRSHLAASLAVRMAKDRGASFGAGAAEELVDLCNADLAAIRAEIDKLSTYVGSGHPISRSDVQALVVSEKKYSVWELAEMLATGQRSQAMIFLDHLLREGEPAPALVGAMAWMYRKLLEAQELNPHASPGQAAGQLGMRRATAEMALRHARKIPRRRLIEGLRALYDADSRVKSGAADNRAVLEFLVARLVGEENQRKTA